MLIAVVLAAAVLVGSHPAALLIGVLAAWHPGWFLAAVGVWAIVQHRRAASQANAGPGDEAAFLHGLAAELRSGSSLRMALGAAHASAPNLRLEGAARMARAGLPVDAIADGLRYALPVNGRLTGAAFVLTSETGARAADVFDALAVRATDAGELVRERMALTAQARLSALVVGLAPLAFAGVVMLTGGGSELLAAGVPGLVVAALGFGLQFTGLFIVWLMLRGAGR